MLLGVMGVGACDRAGTPTAPAVLTVTLAGNDLIYQRVSNETSGYTTADRVTLVIGRRADTNQPGIANCTLFPIGDQRFTCTCGVTLDRDTDYWIYVSDPTRRDKYVCCWFWPDFGDEFLVFGQRLTRTGTVTTGTSNRFSVAAHFSGFLVLVARSSS